MLLNVTQTCLPTNRITCFQPTAVQILFEQERKHWIMTSLQDGEVRLYNSCFHGHKLSASIEEQLVRIYKTSVTDRVLPVTVIPVQQQTGSVDCGVFSIAFAYHAALGENVGRITFAQQEMRQHLVQCFYARKLTPFPKESKKMHRCRKRHLFIPLYCTCGFPESYDSDMISCDGCGQWFHYRCMHIKTPPPDTWFCSHCSKISFTTLFFCKLAVYQRSNICCCMLIHQYIYKSHSLLGASDSLVTHS